jgi:hypothetical protein
VTEYKLGKIAGISVSARPSAITGSILLLVVFVGVSIGVLQMTVIKAIFGSLCAVVLHWISAFVHQLGHAWAARRTGYPMIGIRFGSLGLLSVSLYPPDESDLPASIHIRRALGGPTGSLIASLVAALLTLLLGNSGGLPWWLAVFFFLDNFVVFTLGPFLPLGFTDGSTLLHWWGKR